MWRVDVFEMEKGWGNRLECVEEFKTREQAEDYVCEFNSKNDRFQAPDWYFYAGEPYFV